MSSAAPLLGACSGADHPPVIDDTVPTSRGGSRGNGGGADSGSGAEAGDNLGTGNASATSGSGPGDPGDPGDPGGPGTACAGLDPEHAHFYGSFKLPADDSAHVLEAIAPNLDPTSPCVNLATPFMPVVEPASNAVVFINGEFARRLLRAVPTGLSYVRPGVWDLGVGIEDDELIDTSGCETGPAVFHLSPLDGSIIYNCGSYVDSGVDLHCESRGMQLKPFDYVCLDGPYYSGKDVILEGPQAIIGFAADGRWVVANPKGRLRLGYMDPETKTETPFTSEETLLAEAPVAGRAHADGLWLAMYERIEGVDHFYRVSVDAEGRMTNDGEYGQLAEEERWYLMNYEAVIDGAGDLFLSVNLGVGPIVGSNEGVVHLPFGGEPKLVYDPRNAPPFDRNNALISDAFVLNSLQSPIFSGPTLRF